MQQNDAKLFNNDLSNTVTNKKKQKCHNPAFLGLK